MELFYQKRQINKESAVSVKVFKVKVNGEGIFCAPLDEVAQQTLCDLMIFDGADIGEKREVVIVEMTEEEFKNLKDC